MQATSKASSDLAFGIVPMAAFCDAWDASMPEQGNTALGAEPLFFGGHAKKRVSRHGPPENVSGFFRALLLSPCQAMEEGGAWMPAGGSDRDQSRPNASTDSFKDDIQVTIQKEVTIQKAWVQKI